MAINLWEIIEKGGWLVALLIIAGVVIIWFVRSAFMLVFNTLKEKLDSFEASLQLLERAAVSEEGQAVSQAKQLEILREVAAALEKHSDKCLGYHSDLSDTTHSVSEIRSDIEQFVQDGKESRKLTQENVARLGDRLDSFMEKLLEIIKNLSEIGARRGN